MDATSEQDHDHDHAHLGCTGCVFPDIYDGVSVWWCSDGSIVNRFKEDNEIRDGNWPERMVESVEKLLVKWDPQD